MDSYLASWKINHRSPGHARAEEQKKGWPKKGGPEQGANGFPCRFRDMDFLNIPVK